VLDPHDRARWERWTGEGPPRDRAVTVPGDVELGSARPRPGPEAPDVVVVLLDALRADRVGAWGYHRDTTPNIDRLAREGVALGNVFAEAPYTRSSVATLFTGHSWRDHQVLGKENALGRHFTTIAELLQEHGWSTLAISDNPNVARSAGSDQGFDRFIETWTDAEVEPMSPDWWWPERPLVIWERVLAGGLDPERPVFAYLHLLPPHDPYFPGPDHDLFGPEGYDGPVVGDGNDIRGFERGRLGSDPADQERLEALYDGGLRRGDALLARALEAWDALGRSRPRLLVILSDHGEAFGEHGRYGHNTSVHREMTHVPVVLHPNDLVPSALAASPDALRSLADLYPILVRVLGLELPAGTTWPERMLEVMEDPARARDEIFIRCGTPRFGRRTADGLWVFQAGREQAWFDLAADPRAHVNRATAEPDSWFEGLSAIRAFLAAPIGEGVPAPATLTEEDRERLDALGYE
jgi:arylsulfatase